MTPPATLDAWLGRVGLRTVGARDGALAVVVAVLTVAVLAVLTGLTGPLAAGLDVTLEPVQRALLLGVAAAQALAVGVRRLRPRTCLVLVAALQVLLSATVSTEATVRGAAGLIAFYTAGTCLPLAPLVGWGAVALVVEVVGTPLVELMLRPSLPPAASDPAATPLTVGTWAVGAVSVVLLYAATAAAGVAVATRRENVALLEARAAAVEAGREADTRRAVEAERLRMARELHDIAAHHLTGLLVQASAAERLVATDQAAARRAVLEVRAQGKQALDNLRTVVGVLRRDDGAPELDPVPGVAGLPELVDTARGLGDRVALETVGRPYALAPVADVSAFRVAQEALSNARQHAPGQAVEVTLAYTDDAVRLSLRNATPAGPPAGPPDERRPGFGLAGMHERAALVGGTLDAGPVAGPAWRVVLVLPRPGAGTALDDRPDGAP